MAAHLCRSPARARRPDHRKPPLVERTEGKMTIKSIFVVGAGTMGNGIAQTAAVSGYQVTMMDVAEEFVKRGLATIAKSVDKLVGKGKLTADQKSAASAVSGATELERAAEADLVIEAATENPELKFKLFAD